MPNNLAFNHRDNLFGDVLGTIRNPLEVPGNQEKGDLREMQSRKGSG